MKLFTVYSVCRRYVKQEYQLREDSYAKEKKVHFEDWQLKELMSDHLLTRFMRFNLNQRCEWIWRNWQVAIHKNALGDVYRANGVRFLAAKYHFSLR